MMTALKSPRSDSGHRMTGQRINRDKITAVHFAF